MSLSVNAKTYNADSVGPNLVGYAGPLHTSTVKDKLNLGRTNAKPTSLFSGVTRTDAKLTRTLTLTGALTPTGDGILDIRTSMPVGAAAADIDAFLDDLGAFLASATYKDFVKKLAINW